MPAQTTLKVAQLSALPAVLVAIALGKTPRHPGAERGGPETDGPVAPVVAERFFAGGEAPSVPLDLERVAAAVTSQTGGWFQVTVIGELADEAAALRVREDVTSLLAAAARHFEETGGDELRARLLGDKTAAPLSPAEAAAFAKRGVRSEIGIGWPGSSQEAKTAVLALGRLVVVPGLKGDFAKLRPNPLAAYLEAQGARVLVEGDPASSESAAVDLALDAPDEAAAARLAGALDEYFRAAPRLFLRPPWHPDGVSIDEARGRRTFVALDRAVKRAFRDPHLYDELRARVRRGGDPTEIARGFEEIRRERALAAIDAAAKTIDADPVVVELVKKAQSATRGMLDPATRLRLGERLGALDVEVGAATTPGATPTVAPTVSERAFGATGKVQVQGRRVSLGGVVFHRFAQGLPQLLALLRREKASDVKLAVTPDERPAGPVPDDIFDPEGD